MRPPKQQNTSNNLTVPLLPNCIAKTTKLSDGTIKEGINVETHSRIVGSVARELIRRMPSWLQEALFPKGTILIAASHDVGKISPTFQKKIKNSIAGHKKTLHDLEKEWGYHAGISQASLEDAGRYIAGIAGQHHGYSPIHQHLATDEAFGGLQWQSRRNELITCLCEYFNEQWPDIKDEIQAGAIAGLTTVSDWIGSGENSDENDQVSEKNINNLLDGAGFIKPKIKRGLSFGGIFGFDSRQVQNCLVDSVKERSVYVLEAPMGIGKTEAALYAAYNLLESENATGIYFAMPTQLTSDKIWERLNQFLEKILAEDCPHRKALLMHGNAWLQKSVMGVDAEPGMSWFNSNKRAILAPFAVGTLDQSLMAVMNVKHGFVRAFGLAGKVVILDEVHTYDSYTGTILNYLIDALKRLHCTVIILSATLTGERRNALLGVKEMQTAEKVQNPYPLVTALNSKNNHFKEVPAETIHDETVLVKILEDDKIAVEEALCRAERGEQILWIENTVGEAQEIYRLLGARAKEIGVTCGLLHSRFLKVDREKNETLWVGLYGKNGKEERIKSGRILIGTQVLEQSIDIDSDFLVTRICPSDMLLQRIGRLWRHRENNLFRNNNARRETWILAPPLEQAIKADSSFKKSKYVYEPYILCRTIEVWNGLAQICIPGQIRSLIEETYCEREEQNNMAEYKFKLERKRDQLQQMARIGISTGGKTLPESKASTRYTELESTEVLLACSIEQTISGSTINFLDNSSVYLPKKSVSLTAAERRKIAGEIIMNTVSVPDYSAPETVPIRELSWIKDYVYIGNDDENPFRIAIVSASGDLVGLGHNQISLKYQLTYTKEMGYSAIKIKR